MQVKYYPLLLRINLHAVDNRSNLAKWQYWSRHWDKLYNLMMKAK